MDVLTACVGNRTGNELFTVDCLRDGDELWLVTQWYVDQSGKWRTPGLAIRVDQWVHQAPTDRLHQVHVQPIAKAVLDGLTDTHEGEHYETVREEKAEARFGWLPVRAAS